MRLTLEKIYINFRCRCFHLKMLLLVVGLIRKNSERGFMEKVRSWLMALLNGEVDGFSLNGSVLNPYQLSLSQLCLSNWEDFESAF